MAQENITNEMIKQGVDVAQDQVVEQASEAVAKSGGKGKWMALGALAVGVGALIVTGVKKLKAKCSKKKPCECNQGECNCDNTEAKEEK